MFTKQNKSEFKLSTNKFGIVSIVGELLKRQREHIKLSQKEIANKLNYRNFNFISMLESGESKIPFNRIPDVVHAYDLENEFIMIFIKVLHPDIWAIIKEIKSNIEIFNSQTNVNQIDKEIDRMFKNKLKQFQLLNAI